jgi:hypothetical protein
MKKKIPTKKPAAKSADKEMQVEYDFSRGVCGKQVEKLKSTLAPDELVKLAKRMVETNDPVEAARLRKEIVRGFYGGQSHA